jgi:hypothetical protein
METRWYGLDRYNRHGLFRTMGLSVSVERRPAEIYAAARFIIFESPMPEVTTLKAVIYHVSNRETGERGFQLIEYDAAAPCQICGLPVGTASTGGSAICPACDCGRKRPGARPREYGRKVDPWANAKNSWFFPLEFELAAYQKLLEIDPSPIHRDLLASVERSLERGDPPMLWW